MRFLPALALVLLQVTSLASAAATPSLESRDMPGICYGVCEEPALHMEHSGRKASCKPGSIYRKAVANCADCLKANDGDDPKSKPDCP